MEIESLFGGMYYHTQSVEHISYPGAVLAADGEIVGPVGSNCAGKSTLMKVIMGVVRPTRGTVTFAGAALGGLAVEEVVRHGVVLVPEGRGILGSVTVGENLQLGAYQRRDARDGVTVLLVEQNAAEALRLAHRAYVLETGRVVLEGKAPDLLQHERVREAYLGT